MYHFSATTEILKHDHRPIWYEKNILCFILIVKLTLFPDYKMCVESVEKTVVSTISFTNLLKQETW